MRRGFGLHHTAAAITTFAPPMETFSKGRGFAAWVGLTPRQHSSGGKDRLGRTSTMGQRDIRRFDEHSWAGSNRPLENPGGSPLSITRQQVGNAQSAVSFLREFGAIAIGGAGIRGHLVAKRLEGLEAHQVLWRHKDNLSPVFS